LFLKNHFLEMGLSYLVPVISCLDSGEPGLPVPVPVLCGDKQEFKSKREVVKEIVGETKFGNHQR
jgi:hypothetical protein